MGDAYYSEYGIINMQLDLTSICPRLKLSVIMHGEEISTGEFGKVTEKHDKVRWSEITALVKNMADA